MCAIGPASIEERRQERMRAGIVKEQMARPLALACEPRWLEISREDLTSMQRQLSELIGERTKAYKDLDAAKLNPELVLLQRIWEMLKDVLA